MMFGFSRAVKCGAAMLAASFMLIAAALPSYADSGTVRFRVVKAGFIFGAGGGSGTLVFHGRSYPLSIGGLSVGTIGAARADVVGRGHNLRRGGGGAVAGARTSARLRNASGVVMELRGRQGGLEASLNLSGITVSMR